MFQYHACISQSWETEKKYFKVLIFKFQLPPIIKTHAINLFISLGEKLKENEIDEMIAHADTNGDGVINYDQWVSLMTSL